MSLWIQNYFELSFEERQLFPQPKSCKPVAHRHIRLADVLYLAHMAFCRIWIRCQHLKMVRFFYIRIWISSCSWKQELWEPELWAPSRVTDSCIELYLLSSDRTGASYSDAHLDPSPQAVSLAPVSMWEGNCLYPDELHLHFKPTSIIIIFYFSVIP